MVCQDPFGARIKIVKRCGQRWGRWWRSWRINLCFFPRYPKGPTCIFASAGSGWRFQGRNFVENWDWYWKHRIWLLWLYRIHGAWSPQEATSGSSWPGDSWSMVDASHCPSQSFPAAKTRLQEMIALLWQHVLLEDVPSVLGVCFVLMFREPHRFPRSFCWEVMKYGQHPTEWVGPLCMVHATWNHAESWTFFSALSRS